MCDDPREHEVQWGASPFRDHGVHHVRERAAADEEGERLVLVRGPRPEIEAERGSETGRSRRDCDPERANGKIARGSVRERDSTCGELGHQKGDSGGYPLRMRW